MTRSAKSKKRTKTDQKRPFGPVSLVGTRGGSSVATSLLCGVDGMGCQGLLLCMHESKDENEDLCSTTL